MHFEGRSGAKDRDDLRVKAVQAIARLYFRDRRFKIERRKLSRGAWKKQ